MTSSPDGFVLLTDRAWPDADIERSVCAEAGLTLLDATTTGGYWTDLARDAIGLLVNWARIDADIIEGAPRLRAITRLGVGVDNIDLAAAARRGIAVSRVPDYCLAEVADHVLALVTAWCRRLIPYRDAVRQGDWTPEAHEQRRLSALTVGIWGTGPIGLAVAERFVALGCRVLVDDRHPERTPSGARALPVAEILAHADVVSIHLPATSETRGIVDANVIGAMRPGALLVNTGRGAVVDLEALRTAVTGRRIEAALDVLPDEPVIPEWLRRCDGVIVTPHVAFASRESLADLRERAARDLVAMLNGGEPRYSTNLMSADAR